MKCESTVVKPWLCLRKVGKSQHGNWFCCHVDTRSRVAEFRRHHVTKPNPRVLLSLVVVVTKYIQVEARHDFWRHDKLGLASPVINFEPVRSDNERMVRAQPNSRREDAACGERAVGSESNLRHFQ